MGPSTVKVLSKVPSAVEREVHPARSRLARAADAANVVNAFVASGARLCELVIWVVGIFARAIVTRDWASFLSEIYEDVQPEVPGAGRNGTSETKAARFVPKCGTKRPLHRQRQRHGKCDGTCTANAMTR